MAVSIAYDATGMVAKGTKLPPETVPGVPTEPVIGMPPEGAPAAMAAAFGLSMVQPKAER